LSGLVLNEFTHARLEVTGLKILLLAW